MTNKDQVIKFLVRQVGKRKYWDSLVFACQVARAQSDLTDQEIVQILANVHRKAWSAVVHDMIEAKKYGQKGESHE